MVISVPRTDAKVAHRLRTSPHSFCLSPSLFRRVVARVLATGAHQLQLKAMRCQRYIFDPSLMHC